MSSWELKIIKQQQPIYMMVKHSIQSLKHHHDMLLCHELYPLFQPIFLLLGVCSIGCINSLTIINVRNGECKVGFSFFPNFNLQVPISHADEI